METSLDERFSPLYLHTHTEKAHQIEREKQRELQISEAWMTLDVWNFKKTWPSGTNPSYNLS